MPLWTYTKKPVWEDKETAEGKVTVQCTRGGHLPYNTDPGWLMKNTRGHKHAELLVCIHLPCGGDTKFILQETGYYLFQEDGSRLIWEP
jgi:hypothetical protein